MINELLVVVGIVSGMMSLLIMISAMWDVNDALIDFYNKRIHKRTSILYQMGLRESANILESHLIKTWRDLL